VLREVARAPEGLRQEDQGCHRTQPRILLIYQVYTIWYLISIGAHPVVRRHPPARRCPRCQVDPG
jgi:hypothetical protein